MLEAVYAIVLLVVVAMMLGILEVPGGGRMLRSGPDPRKTGRTSDPASLDVLRAEEIVGLRRRFRTRLQ